jgi:putative ABC transport system permease protein
MTTRQLRWLVMTEAGVIVAGLALAYSVIAVANVMAIASAGRRSELLARRLAGATGSQVLGLVATESAICAAIGTVAAASAVIGVLAAVSTAAWAMREPASALAGEQG